MINYFEKKISERTVFVKQTAIMISLLTLFISAAIVSILTVLFDSTATTLISYGILVLGVTIGMIFYNIANRLQKKQKG